MFKQLLGKLPGKASFKSPHNDTDKDSNLISSPFPISKNFSSSAKESNWSASNSKTINGDITSDNNNSINKVKKSVPIASHVNTILVSTPYEALPNLRDIVSSEKQSVLIRKLNMCCVIFDFTDSFKNVKEKDIKRQTLLELVDYISSVKSKFNEATMQAITKMVASNSFRVFPSSNDNNFLEIYDPEDDETPTEPSWPHLQLVYELFHRYVASPETDAKLAKRYIDRSFILKLLDLFESEDKRERGYLKTILHRIYGKFMVHRPFIRKSLNNIFFRFLYETEKHNGIAELLEILGSIINGFALPLKEEHKLFLVKVLIPLHKPKCVPMYHEQLTYCITQYVQKDFKLVDIVIRGILKYWPVINSSKEVLFLNEIDEVLEVTPDTEFQRCMIPLFCQIGRCIDSSHFQVAERALSLWKNDNTSNLVYENCKVILPIILPSLERNSRNHWNQAVQSSTLTIRNFFWDSNQALFDECLAKFEEDEDKKRQERDNRELKWKHLDDLAAFKDNDEDMIISEFMSSVEFDNDTK